MQVEKLVAKRILVQKLSILSFEMNIYLVSVLTSEYQGLIRNSDGTARRFRSVQEVKDEFESCNVKFAELIHESPYDEMIGNPPRANDQMVLPININYSVFKLTTL